ncbi:MAG: Holliday junction branch migration protein RuvA [Bacteroidia bacterium]|nr:Holliday junction branch migration protein RuvA [Bacteroidia bacterium]NNJ55028.1 Holliday junction branch migration protein RuvA [Bacteroidia bacterium]
MFDFISGKTERITPTEIVVNCNGVGYLLHISLNTFEKLKSKSEVKIFAHLVVREDSQTLYGFATMNEREMYVKLLGVNGVGPSTARMILSAMSVDDVVSAITNSNIAMLKSIKGIGPKAAQRLVIELQDKLGGIGSDSAYNLHGSNQEIEEASDALLALGFSRPAVSKVLAKISKDSGNKITTEELIKKSLQLL